MALAISAANAQVLPPPAIGGSPAAFEQVFGGANDASIGAILHFQRCAGTDVDQFLPPDAVAGAPFTTDVGESAQSYQSATLAAALPAGLFHDCLGNPVTPGTLFVVADAYGGWFMGPGSCPSQ